MLQIAALVSVLVWLGVLALLIVAWVDDRRREDDEIARQSKLGGWSQRTPTPVAEPVGAAVGDRFIV
jgi:hypothetical protein